MNITWKQLLPVFSEVREIYPYNGVLKAALFGAVKYSISLVEKA